MAYFRKLATVVPMTTHKNKQPICTNQIFINISITILNFTYLLDYFYSEKRVRYMTQKDSFSASPDANFLFPGNSG